MDIKRTIFNATTDWVYENPSKVFSLKDIEVESALPTGTVQSHFPNEQQLIEFVHSTIQQEYDISYPDLPIGQSVKSQLIFHYKNMVQFLYDYPEYFLFIKELWDGGLGKRLTSKKHVLPYKEFIGPIDFAFHQGLVHQNNIVPMVSTITMIIIRYVGLIHSKDMVLHEDVLERQAHLVWEKIEHYGNIEVSDSSLASKLL